MKFDKELIDSIKILVRNIKKENGIVNEIIRDDVFSILQDCNCTVLYYPLEDENIDGCHIEKPVNGKLEQFVFINSHNKRERQAFSAAHELGHIWKVDDRLRKKYPDREIDTEMVVNRFAAELLMPEKLFREAITKQLDKLKYQGPTMEMSTMLKLVAHLMNYFFVPFKSVIIRFNELGFLNEKYNDITLKYKDSNELNEIIRDEQYTRLGIINDLKSMDNLQEYLVQVESQGIFNESKINNIRKEFEIRTVSNSTPENVEF